MNLRGTGISARDVVLEPISATVGDDRLTVDVRTTGLAGFLLAKAAAAHSRQKPKDWYDIAFILLENDLGGPTEAAAAVRRQFGSELKTWGTSINNLRANFADISAQGAAAYAEQMMTDHPDADRRQLSTDAVLAIEAFASGIGIHP